MITNYISCYMSGLILSEEAVVKMGNEGKLLSIMRCLMYFREE